MDACADESLYHFTATVGHRNFDKAVHLGGQDRSGFQGAGGGAGYSGRFRPKVQPLTLLYAIFDREDSTPFVFLSLANVTTSIELCTPSNCCK